jgi:hypothetical protein
LKRHFEQLATGDFPLVLSVLSQQSELLDTEVLSMLFRVWAERAPKDGAQFVMTVPEYVRETTVGAFGRAWLRRDLPSAEEWAKKNLSGRAFDQFSSYARREAQARAPKPAITSLEDIMKLPDADRESAIVTYINKVRQDKPAEALTLLARISDEARRIQVFGSLATDFARRDPAAFLHFIASPEANGLDRSPFTGPARLSAVTALAKTDPNAARAYAASMPAGGQRNQFTDYVAAALIESDRDAAFDYVEKYQAENPDAQFGGFLKALVSLEPGRAGPLLAAQITRMDAEKSGRSGDWVANVMQDWIHKDPAAASNFGATLPDGTHPSVFYAVGKEWCRRDGAAALRRASTQLDGPPRAEAMRQMTFCWAEHDAIETTAWLETLPADSGRWAATEGFVFATVDSDPDAALAWLRSIPDESKRLAILPRLMRVWSRKNHDSARDWLEHAELTEVERKSIDEAP